MAFVVLLTALGAFAQQPQLPTNSAASSASSATAAAPKTEEIVAACSAAADELKASRALLAALEKEARALSERLATETQRAGLLAEINAARRSEADALRNALAAAVEAQKAKDAAIDAQQALIASLKKKKRSPLERLTDILIGAAAVAIFK
jgi:septal ring factor EnvC (AmiA/AmiB activator)